jgi:DNA-binding transcriptional MerR regulator
MLKLFLEKFRNLSIEEIDKIINLEDKNPLSILEKIREIKQIISKKRIIDKTKAIYLRNSSLESINNKIKLLLENESEIYKMDKYYIKILNQNQ